MWPFGRGKVQRSKRVRSPMTDRKARRMTKSNRKVRVIHSPSGKTFVRGRVYRGRYGEWK